jgi:N utilization substance protein B
MSGKPVPKSVVKRSRARLAAAQALYQLELGGDDAGEVVAEFESHRLGFESDAAQGEILAEADEKLFSRIVNGVVNRQVEIDKSIAGALVEGWALDRVDSTLRAVLRAATYELLAEDGVPARVVLDEYVRVTGAFFDGEEVRFANGVLNTLARRMRAAEFA